VTALDLAAEMLEVARAKPGVRHSADNGDRQGGREQCSAHYAGYLVVLAWWSESEVTTDDLLHDLGGRRKCG